MSDHDPKTITEEETPGQAERAQVGAIPAPVKPPAPEQSSGPRLGFVGVMTRRRIVGALSLGHLLAGLLVLVVVALGLRYLRQEVVVEVAAPRAELPEVPAFPSELSPGELVVMGEGALANDDVENAARYLEEARVRAELERSDDINLFVDVFEGLARVAELRGRPKVAELYRGYVRGKQAELGSSLPLFSEAEKLFRAGELAAARRNYARFLLTRASLGAAGERYLKRAEQRLAEIWEAEYLARVGGLVSVAELAEPKEFFRARD